jgi:hypothetical protein
MFSKKRCTYPPTLSTENRKLLSFVTQIASPSLLGHGLTQARADAYEPKKTHCAATVGSLLHFQLARPA